MKSIQTKLTVIILSIFVVATATLGGLNYWKARAIIFEDVTTNLKNEAQDTAGLIDNWLETSKLELAGIATSPVLQAAKGEEIVPYLKYLKRERGRYENYGFVFPDGKYYDEAGSSGSLKDRAYIQKALQGEAAVSDPVISRGTGILVTLVAVPVKSNNQVVGALFGAISMENMTEKVLGKQVGDTGYATLIRSDGLTIIHPDKSFVMQVNPVTDTRFSEEIRSIHANIIKGGKGVTQYSYAGVSKIVAFTPLNNAKWFLTINVPTAEVTESLSSLTWISLVTILVVLVLTGIIIAFFARRIAQPIQSLELAANKIASGDLSQTNLNIQSNDEIGRLAKSFEKMTQNISRLIQQISNNAEQLAASSEELTASADESTQAANQVAGLIQEAATDASTQMRAADESSASVTEISLRIEEVASNANSVANQTESATAKALQGEAAVDKAVTQMGQIEQTVNTSAQVVVKLGERSHEIGQIVEVISGIAGQTNLLALNAAIEAARAGEQGKGFAVVAEEVRKLAEQSEVAAKKISDLIVEIQTDTGKAVQAMEQGTQEVKIGAEVVNAAGVSFREIAVLVTDVSGQVKNMSKAIQDMSQGSQRIVKSVNAINGLSKKNEGAFQGVSAATEEQLASMTEIARASRALATLAQELQIAVKNFRT